jgi:putative ABC transport system ATP-binding protein
MMESQSVGVTAMFTEAERLNTENRETILRAAGIKRVFNKGKAAVTALEDIHLGIWSGSMVALKGRSGSGKTTLLNILSALDDPTEGQVFFKEQEITGLSVKERDALRRTEVGLIFQSFGLIPLMSAFENVEFGLRVAGTPVKSNREAAETALDLVGMRKRMKHRPLEMSGGEQQRVAIARAIAHKPALLIADEPTAELDSKMGLQVMRVFRDLVSRSGMTVLLTTHDPEIMELVDNVIALEDGKIVSQTTDESPDF